MLNIEYLKSLLAAPGAGLPSITSVHEQVIDSPDGLEGLEELCQLKHIPYAVLFEEAYHYDDTDIADVPLTRCSQSIYVVRMASAAEPSRLLEQQCMDDVKRIRALLLAHRLDPELSGWDRTAQRDYVRGAAGYVGWKLKINFTENEAWTL